MWWNKHKRKLLLAIVLAAILAAAFWGTGEQDPGVNTVATPAQAETARPDGQDPAHAAGAPPAATGSPTSAQRETPAPPAPEVREAAASQAPAPAVAAPVEESQEAPSAKEERHCTISISCATLLDKLDRLDAGKAELIPENGWILAPSEVAFDEGESVFDVLLRTCRQDQIHMEFSNTPLYDNAYIEGIHNLYEFDCGPLSGWMYQVNGRFQSYGCSQYTLEDGDEVCFVYSCDLGEDVGGRASSSP